MVPIDRYYISLPEREDCRKELIERSYEIDTKLKIAKKRIQKWVIYRGVTQMKVFDHKGLLLAEHQGKLFEKSAELDCSTAVFLRRFFHSDYLKKLDQNEVVSLSLDVNEAIASIESQFGASTYGKTKFAKSALFWIGYMYRYNPAIKKCFEKKSYFLLKKLKWKISTKT